MKILRIVVGICLILAVAWAVLLRARRGTESMAALRKFRYAHRGLYDKEAGIPENSLPAFSRAIARGFGAELDVHLLRDGSRYSVWGRYVDVLVARGPRMLIARRGVVAHVTEGTSRTYNLLPRVR